MSGPEYLYENEGEQLQWGPDGPQRVKLQPAMGPLERSSLEGGRFNVRRGLGGTSPAPGSFSPPRPVAGPSRAPTPEELMRQAEEALDAAQAQRAAQLDSPALGERDAAGYRIPDWLAKTMKSGDTEL